MCCQWGQGISGAITPSAAGGDETSVAITLSAAGGDRELV